MTTEVGPAHRRGRRWFLLPIVVVLLGATWYVWKGRSSSHRPDVPGSGLATTDTEVGDTIEAARGEVARQPESGALWGKLGEILHVHGYTDQALACYTEASRLDPANPDWPYLCALIRLVGPSPSDAIPDLQRSAEHEGGGHYARLRLGELFLELGRVNDAAETFRAVLAANPESPRAHLGLARVAAESNDWTECLAQLGLLANVPARHQAALLRITALQNLGRDADAAREREVLDQLREPDPTWPDPVSEHLKVYLVGVRGRLQRARQMLEDGDTAMAIKLLLETVEKYPTAATCWTSLGRARAIAGDLPGAEAALQRSIELSPDAADGWTTLGYVRRLRGNPAGALEAYRTVTRLRPTDAEAHEILAECLEETGDPAGAIDAYRTALRYDPHLQSARTKLGRLKPGE